MSPQLPFDSPRQFCLLISNSFSPHPLLWCRCRVGWICSGACQRTRGGWKEKVCVFTFHRSAVLTLLNLFRAMALKALDQRLANTASPVGSHSANPAPSQSRQPPTIARSESGGSSTSQPTNGRPDRSKSLSESDDSAKAKSDSQ